MLLPRVLSAIVMAALFIVAVFVLGETAFSVSIGAVMLLAGWEWARLAGFSAQTTRVAYAGMIGTLCYGVSIFALQQSVLYLAPLAWLLALVWVIRFPSQIGWQHRSVRALFGAVILITSWSALVVLRQSPNFVVWVLLLMGLIWGADSGAYFAGRAFGKRKLAVRVSPGKSWEGVIGGILLTQVGVVIFSYLQGASITGWSILAVAALITVFVSVLGDLSESLFKRYESLKDSSQLIPGHGGVMDRVDSLTAAAPIFVLLLLLVGWL